MEEFEFIIDNASNFSKEEIASFKKIVLDAGEVSSATFDGLIEKNPILLFHPNTKDIKAVGALKIPNQGYKERVFKESKSKAENSNFKYELGWVVCLDMSQIGLNSNIYNISSKYLEKFNDFLAVLNYNPDNITEQHRTELRNIVIHLLDKNSLDYQIQMVYMIIDDYLKENNKKSQSVLEQLLSYLEEKTESPQSAIKSLELITNALDQECDYAFSRIQKR